MTIVNRTRAALLTGTALVASAPAFAAADGTGVDLPTLITTYISATTVGIGLAAIFGVGLAVKASVWAYSTVFKGISASR